MGRIPPKNGSSKKIKISTLVVDGNALFKRGFSATKDVYNDKGEPIGGVYQFLLVLRRIIEENLYHKVFVFWDGKFSGKMRWEIYKDYKGNRDKDYENGTEPEDQNEILQRQIVFNYLEELYIRQLFDEKVEADDFIAYYCNTKLDTEKITVVTSDRDLCQLVHENVRMYMIDLKDYVYVNNFKKRFGYHYENVAVIKILCGDNSDNIKGVKRLGEETLFNFMPELKERKVTLDEVLNRAKELQDNRVENKKSRLKVLDNIINGITDGVQGDQLYTINHKLVDLTSPLIHKQALNEVNDLITSPLSDDRSIKSVYRMLKEDGLDKMLGQYRYENFLLPFKKLMEREKKRNIIN
tara:strand:- start:9139 stop:10197 length:1059 start_codon:yes stop_codon:yes gene_type:complete